MAKKNVPAQLAVSLPTSLEDMIPKPLSELNMPHNSILDEVTYRAINHVDDRVARDVLTHDLDMIGALAHPRNYDDNYAVRHLNDWIAPLSRLTLDEDVTFSSASVSALLYALVTAKIQITYLHEKRKKAKHDKT